MKKMKRNPSVIQQLVGIIIVCGVSSVEAAQLTVTSDHGSPSPAVGVIQYTDGQSVTAVLSGTPSAVQGENVRWVCTGWTGTGSVPASGEGTNVTFIITQDSSITWNWKKEVWLQITSIGGGNAGARPGWYQESSTLELQAAPEPRYYYQFDRWEGEIDGCTTNGSVCTFVVDHPRKITACFRNTTKESEKPVSLKWLADNGLVSDGDYEAAAKKTAANGRPVWQCFEAGLDPKDPDSRFYMTIDMDAQPFLAWGPDLGGERIYTIEGKTNLLDRVPVATDGWIPLDHLPMTVEDANGFHFFRAHVTSPNYPTETAGLIYKLDESGTGYIANGIEDDSLADIVIPTLCDYGEGLHPVTEIGYGAFQYSIYWKSLVIPNTVKMISGGAFIGAWELETVILSNSITNIEDYAFSDCYALKSINIPQSVANIGDFAFMNSLGLQSITVDEGNSVYHSAGNCLIETETKTLLQGSAKSVIPSDGSVTSIHEAAFSGNADLPSIVIPGSVDTIGKLAFGGCPKLASVNIQEGVTEIGYRAFAQCKALTSISIPNSVKRIENEVFADCSKLETIEIPDTIEHLGQKALNNTLWYKNQTDGLVYVASDKILYQWKGEMPENTHVEILDGVIGIAGGAFLNRQNLTQVKIPTSVWKIDDAAFQRCGLTEVSIPEGVTTIGSGAFQSCSALETITISDSVQIIEANAFEDTPWLTRQPDGLVYAGKVAYQWKGAMPENTEVKIKSGTTGISPNAFWGCENLVCVTIPASVKRIEENVFKGCTNLRTINFSGTKAQWEAVTKVYSLEKPFPATVVHCTDGDASI